MLRILLWCIVAVATVALFAGPALAQDDPAAEPQGKAYALSYVLLVLLVGLGLLAAVKPDGRSEELK